MKVLLLLTILFSISSFAQFNRGYRLNGDWSGRGYAMVDGVRENCSSAFIFIKKEENTLTINNSNTFCETDMIIDSDTVYELVGNKIYLADKEVGEFDNTSIIINNGYLKVISYEGWYLKVIDTIERDGFNAKTNITYEKF